MTTQTVKLDKDKVDFLPKDLQKSWEGADVLMISSEDMITLKRVPEPEPEFWKTWKKLKSAGRGITAKDIDDTVREVRSGRP
ncbi:MAG: hypothetical protein HYT31_02960 [Parcubacteria group bacterium]|nr:hypothetical protein [Parcubacteria group bacterium]